MEKTDINVSVQNQSETNGNGGFSQDKDASLHISISDFSFYFGHSQILKKITMPIYKNKVTAIIGPSGCGKSTLLRNLNRMNDLVPLARGEGSILLDGVDIFSNGMDIYDLRARVGMVFQKPNPFPKTIFENIAYGMRIQGENNGKKIAEVVEQSLKDAWLWNEVSDRLDDSALSLSGGQQQRLCIARALANKPEVLLLDEATSALDPQSTQKIEELIEDLKKHVTIVIVTHNIGQAGRVSDTTAFLYLGELIEFGPTKKLFTVPQNPKTEEYLSGKFG